MPTNHSQVLILTSPNELDIDFSATSAWVNETMNAHFEQENARFEEQLAVEQEAIAPIIERSRDLGLIPESSALDQLNANAQLELERLTEELEQSESYYQSLSDEYDVLPQALHVAGHRQTKRPSYNTEAEDQKDGGTDKSFADKATGLMRTFASTNLSSSWDWSRCSIGQMFTMQSNNHLIDPICSFRNHLGIADIWGLFSASTVMLDLQVFTFNVNQNRHWVRSRTIGTRSNMWVGNVGFTLGLPAFFSATGYGDANKGDSIIITATLIARAKAPNGHASLNHSCHLTSMSIVG